MSVNDITRQSCAMVTVSFVVESRGGDAEGSIKTGSLECKFSRSDAPVMQADHYIYYQGSHTSDMDVSDSICIIGTRLTHPELLLVPV